MKLARTMATLARGIPETGTFHFAKFENGILRMGVMGLLGASAAGIYAANQEATPVAKKVRPCFVLSTHLRTEHTLARLILRPSPSPASQNKGKSTPHELAVTHSARQSPADIPGPWTGGFRAKMSQSIPPLFFTPELKQIPSMSAVRPYLEGPVLLGA